MKTAEARCLPMADRKMPEDRCPDFDGDCLHIEEPYDCWNNTYGFFDTTRPGYCPLVHGARPSGGDGR